MRDKIQFRNVDLYYREYGERGKTAVILLHGYLESMDIWKGFAEKLAENFHVIAVDLPGHGKSGVYSKVHRMDDMAEAVLKIADHLNIRSFHLVGHSMGGYVTLAFRESHQDRLHSYVLFHSSCYADTDEKKKNRSREMRMVREGKKQLIVNTNIPKAFADDNLNAFAAEVARAKEIAMNTPDEGIIAVLGGMKQRPERCMLLRDEIVPLLLIAGKKDNYIPYEMMQKIDAMGKNVRMETLTESGHMGFIEERDKSVAILDDFFERHTKRMV